MAFRNFLHGAPYCMYRLVEDDFYALVSYVKSDKLEEYVQCIKRLREKYITDDVIPSIAAPWLAYGKPDGEIGKWMLGALSYEFGEYICYAYCRKGMEKVFDSFKDADRYLKVDMFNRYEKFYEASTSVRLKRHYQRMYDIDVDYALKKIEDEYIIPHINDWTYLLKNHVFFANMSIKDTPRFERILAESNVDFTEALKVWYDPVKYSDDHYTQEYINLAYFAETFRRDKVKVDFPAFGNLITMLFKHFYKKKPGRMDMEAIKSAIADGKLLAY